MLASLVQALKTNFPQLNVIEGLSMDVDNATRPLLLPYIDGSEPMDTNHGATLRLNSWGVLYRRPNTQNNTLLVAVNNELEQVHAGIKTAARTLDGYKPDSLNVEVEWGEFIDMIVTFDTMNWEER